jgi:Leucine-rich repeat (LRR) protein
MKLWYLYCGDANIADLSPLKGMPLKHLNIDSNPLSDLSPLKKLPLSSLNTSFTLLTNLSPLRGMPLTHLHCPLMKVTDFSPLKGLYLKELSFDFKPERDTEILRSIKTLETINDKPAAEFWKEVEETQKAKKP